MAILGIDIGGSGIKGALVDVVQGTMIGERLRISTPQPATPEAVAQTVQQLVQQLNWHGPIGCTFPAIVKNGYTLSAANVDQTWIGANADQLFEQATGCPFHMLNDADAAGLAEMKYGAGKEHNGVVMMLTFGTGIGSALFVQGLLVPNTELGHLEIRGKDAEHRASDRVREEKGWDWPKWAEKVNEVLARIEALFSPDLLIMGGGVSKRFDKFGQYLQTKAPLVPATLQNNAGIIGAALAASELFEQGHQIPHAH
ncbi:ROK family protein [Herpetosiphon gulosus]|uniref:Polyphosphate glucokinase n=1 Tax=Herpetosiphon gulosus TaxID=1973496 RepID=A0ABP9WU84_9CHLR